MVVRELITLFGFKTDDKSVDKLNREITGFFDKIKKLAAIAGATAGFVALKGIAEGVGRLGDDIGTLADRLGVASQALQELIYVSDRYDISREEMTTGLRMLSYNAYQAVSGSKDMAESFARLGVRVRDTNGEVRPAADLLEEAADGMRKLKSPTERTALAQRVFGRSGVALVPMLMQGSESMRAMRLEAEEYGAVMSDELIAKSSDWHESTKDLHYSMQGLRFIIGDALLPRISAFNRLIAATLIKFRKLAAEKLWKTMDKLGQGVEHVAEFILMLLDRVSTLSWKLTPLQNGILKVSLAIGALAAILLLPGGSLLVLMVLLGLLIDDFIVWGKGGKSIIGDLIGSMDDFRESFPGVSTAAMATWGVLKKLGGWVGSLVLGITESLGSLVVFLLKVWDDPEVATKDYFDSIKTQSEDFVKWLSTAGPEIAKPIEEAIATSEERATGRRRGRMAPTIMATPAAAAAAQRVTTTQSNRMDVTVNVAGGAENPEALGQAIAKPVGQVIGTELRNALSDITDAAPGGGA